MGGMGVRARLMSCFAQLLRRGRVHPAELHAQRHRQPKPPEPIGAMLTSAVTGKSRKRALRCRATRLSALWMQAA
jgi:hypothetical protein